MGTAGRSPPAPKDTGREGSQSSRGRSTRARSRRPGFPQHGPETGPRWGAGRDEPESFKNDVGIKSHRICAPMNVRSHTWGAGMPSPQQGGRQGGHKSEGEQGRGDLAHTRQLLREKR